MNEQVQKDFSLSSLRRNYIQPHSLYAAMRSHDCIYFDASVRCWLATGHEVVTSILDDTRFTSNLGNHTALPIPLIDKQLLFLDGDLHRKAQDIMLRQLARIVRGIPEDIKVLAQDLLSAAQQRGAMDIVTEFASPFSLSVIAHVLGMPTSDAALLVQLEKWSDTFSDITSGYFGGNRQDVARLEDYFHTLITEKRQSPQDDLLSALIQASDIYPTEDDLVANCVMLFSAGRATTKKLLGNGLPLLFSHWMEIQEHFQEQPRETVKLLCEELLRVVTPTRCLIRQAREDVDLSTRYAGNHLIRLHEKVLLFLDAANYDPAYFPDPEQIDLWRRPNKQIAFGYGAHQCPGATLARLEIQIALEIFFSLVKEPPVLKPGTKPVWNPNPNLGGYSSCPILFSLPNSSL